MYVAKSREALYSLEKLIEWKQKRKGDRQVVASRSLYSLEKLIEWKLILAVNKVTYCFSSLLAREIN